MIPVTPAFQAAVAGSHTRFLSASVLLPGATDPIGFDISGGSIQATMGTGQRYSGTVDVTPDDSRDWSSILTTPGSIFAVSVDVQVERDRLETVRYLTGELVAAPDVDFYGSGFTLSIGDQWVRLARCRYLTPYITTAAQRSILIAQQVIDAIPTAEVFQQDGGGEHPGELTYDKDRVQAIGDLSVEGGLESGFNSFGRFVIRSTPLVSGTNVWTVEDGNFGTLLAALRSQPIDRMYNMVIARPSDIGDWDQVDASILDEDHPRYWKKIGKVPFFISPSVETEAEARAACADVLRQILQQSQTLKITTSDNPALEPGDTVGLATSGSRSAAEQTLSALCTGITRDLKAGTMDLDLMVGADALIEEAA